MPSEFAIRVADRVFEGLLSRGVERYQLEAAIDAELANPVPATPAVVPGGEAEEAARLVDVYAAQIKSVGPYAVYCGLAVLAKDIRALATSPAAVAKCIKCGGSEFHSPNCTRFPPAPVASTPAGYQRRKCSKCGEGLGFTESDPCERCESTLADKCEHGVLWGMECLACGPSDFVPASEREFSVPADDEIFRRLVNAVDSAHTALHNFGCRNPDTCDWAKLLNECSLSRE